VSIGIETLRDELVSGRPGSGAPADGAPDGTLTNEEADELVGRIRDRLAADFGAELRAG